MPARIERQLERYEHDGFGLLAIEDRATGEVIGDCGPTVQEADGEPYVELGWHVLASRQRQGIATEAGRACRDAAFAVLDEPFPISLIRPENVPSRRVAEKLGFDVWRGTTGPAGAISPTGSIALGDASILSAGRAGRGPQRHRATDHLVVGGLEVDAVDRARLRERCQVEQRHLRLLREPSVRVGEASRLELPVGSRMPRPPAARTAAR